MTQGNYPKKQLNRSIFHARFEEGTVDSDGEMWQDMKGWLSGNKWGGEPRKACLLMSFCVLQSSRINKDATFLWVQRGHLSQGSHDPGRMFQGRSENPS